MADEIQLSITSNQDKIKGIEKSTRTRCSMSSTKSLEACSPWTFSLRAHFEVTVSAPNKDVPRRILGTQITNTPKAQTGGLSG